MALALPYFVRIVVLALHQQLALSLVAKINMDSNKEIIIKEAGCL